jgi:hypothetical protein
MDHSDYRVQDDALAEWLLTPAVTKLREATRGATPPRPIGQTCIGVPSTLRAHSINLGPSPLPRATRNSTALTGICLASPPPVSVAGSLVAVSRT